MKRRRIILPWILFVTVALIGLNLWALALLLPGYVQMAVRYGLGGGITVGRVDFRPPATIVLEDIRAREDDPRTGASLRRLIFKPAGLSWDERVLWFDVVAESPSFRLTRVESGPVLRPNVSRTALQEMVSNLTPVGEHEDSWRAALRTLYIVDGAIEFIDEDPEGVFHGIVHHVFATLGPFGTPHQDAPVAYAARGELVGHEGLGAPIYCSGWARGGRGELRTTCGMEPLALAAFAPYWNRLSPMQVRVYDTALSVTSQWESLGNQMEGIIQLALAPVSEFDISVRGRTIVDMKELIRSRNGRNGNHAIVIGPEPRMLGEVAITGPLSDPGQWKREFVPGNELAQQLLARLRARGLESMNIRIWGQRFGVVLTPASQEAMRGIEAASQRIDEALEIIATPVRADLRQAIEAARAESAAAAQAADAAAAQPAPATTQPTAIPTQEPLPAAPPADSPAAPALEPEPAAPEPELIQEEPEPIEPEPIPELPPPEPEPIAVPDGEETPGEPVATPVTTGT